ncbi:hypothetical protein [Fluviicola taffensis]|uniref:Uncharacterized protein n=1 Tax=Fluviicola taffensis (strain DSM 16823 / NCIMB 13979 / RW262) TaxID=755732 RepID=F2IK84_FLUTR|nr:hypothetical protein [Fluviicola taffensis]AEA43987.1 hypothetical protein Fluta_2001 [Fluviicola taffensis DSM 16823]
MKTNEITALNAQLVELLGAANKGVNVEIAEADFDLLKNGKYALCFAKKVGDNFNVVWKSSKDFLMLNSFTWTPLYQLFGTNSFKGGVTVKASTYNQKCGLGQTCTLDANGKLSSAVDGGSKTALHLTNQYGPVHAGVNQMVTGIDGKEEALPIYVSEKQIIKGTNDLTPKESVLVWFEQNIETSTMFSTSRSNAVELDLTGTNQISVNYSEGEWIIVG